MEELLAVVRWTSCEWNFRSFCLGHTYKSPLFSHSEDIRASSEFNLEDVEHWLESLRTHPSRDWDCAWSLNLGSVTQRKLEVDFRLARGSYNNAIWNTRWAGRGIFRLSFFKCFWSKLEALDGLTIRDAWICRWYHSFWMNLRPIGWINKTTSPTRTIHPFLGWLIHSSGDSSPTRMKIDSVLQQWSLSAMLKVNEMKKLLLIGRAFRWRALWVRLPSSSVR